MINDYCENGANLDFITNSSPLVGHFVRHSLNKWSSIGRTLIMCLLQALDEIAVATAIQFLEDRLNGVPFHTGCNRTTADY